METLRWKGCGFETRLSGLQIAVYWRLCLLLFLNSFLFFLDLYTTCTSRHADHRTDNRTAPEDNRTGPEHGGPTGSSESECVWLSYGQTLYIIGLLLGSLFGGAPSDWYGRRVVLQVCVSVHAVCAVLPAALHHPLFFITLRCLTGVCSSLTHSSAFSLAVEWSVPACRAWPPALLGLSFSLGMVVQAPLAYACCSWAALHLALGLPQILFLPILISLPESPCWLLLKKRTSVLDQYRKQDPEYMQQLLNSTGEEERAEPAEGAEPAEAGPGGLFDLTHLRHPTVMLRLAVMSYLGLTTALTYYGISLNIGSFGVDVYRAQFFSGLSETPCVLLPFLLARCGRRTVSMLTMFLSGLACLLSLVASQIYRDAVWGMSLALLGKFCMLTNMFVSLLYSIELFPTITRQRCLALVNVFYRAGSVFNTLLDFSAGIPLAAMIIYGCGPIIGSLFCLLLPETSQGPLPDSLEDCERQSRVRLNQVKTHLNQVKTHLNQVDSP
ncbi:solute carrier family 22 member 13 [Gadus morhua]|uniref:solute carrier family 22 member 13 n=1 Tax=Gadus morhua TaxID=8049 RepID=UPI0011B8562C|nr:solute carrier family 22 member 13-like [Gadus morhua]